LLISYIARTKGQYPFKLYLIITIVQKVSAWRKVRSAVQWSPFVQTFRRQRYPWVQLAGHQGFTSFQVY
jgi:hypothetical protein